MQKSYSNPQPAACSAQPFLPPTVTFTTGNILDAPVERQIRDFWGKEGKLKGQAQFFRTQRSIAQLPHKARASVVLYLA